MDRARFTGYRLRPAGAAHSILYPMDILITVLLVIVAIFVVAAIIVTGRQNQSLRLEVADRLNAMNAQLLETTGRIDTRLDGANQTLSGVQLHLGELGEASRRMLEVGKDISTLQDVLKPPKMRGILGEVLLQEVLTQILPANCSFQYTFKSGATVDAVIKLGDRLVPVDAKFPLESFRKMVDAAGDDEKAKWRRQFATDVKKHADAIAEKYILPDENTYDFALMYLPTESIYYEVIARDNATGGNAADYAVGRKVIPVSPSTTFAYLQTVMLGLRGLKVEERAAEIVDLISRIRGDMGRFTADFETLGTHLKNAAGKYDEADKRLNKLSLKLDKVETLDD